MFLKDSKKVINTFLFTKFIKIKINIQNIYDIRKQFAQKSIEKILLSSIKIFRNICIDNIETYVSIYVSIIF